MNNLVFLEPDSIKAIPHTTSKVISEFSGVSHKYIKKQITRNKNVFKSFGLLVAHATESTGGRPEEIYQLNEQQATFLMTLLKNTDVVITFKAELVRQFYLMRAELQKRQIGKLELKPTRRTLTDEIQDNPEHGKWDYKLFTDLAYKMVTGKIAVTLRKERGAKPKAIAIDYMTAEEIAQVEKFTYKIAVLYEMGLDYHPVSYTHLTLPTKRIV